MSTAIASLVSLTVAVGLTQPGPAGRAEAEQVLRQAGAATDGPGLVAYFETQARRGADREAIRTAITRLGDPSYVTRERASLDLVRVGLPARASLRTALGNGDLEVQRRAGRCLSLITRGPDRAVLLASARLLTARPAAGAAAAVLAYLPLADDPAVEAELLGTLRAVGCRDDRVDPAVLAALGDRDPARRAGAALVFTGATQSADLDRVKDLLGDPEPLVRLRAAQAVLVQRNPDAIPALLGVLRDGTPDQALRAEELLTLVAGPAAPAAAVTDDGESRRGRAAWARWWGSAKGGVTLDRLDERAVLDRPENLAREVTGRFVQAVVRGNAAGFRRSTAVPFNVQGQVTCTTRDELDRMLTLSDRGNKPVTVGPVLTPADHARFATPAEIVFLSRWRPGQLRMVEVSVEVVSGSTERVVTFVLLSAGEAHVVGVGTPGGTTGVPKPAARK